MLQSFSQLADVVAALFTAIGILLAYRELRRNTRVQRAQFLLDATERYFSDVEVRRLFYDINYHRFKLSFEEGNPTTITRGDETPRPFLHSEDERLLDTLLYTLDVLGRIVRIGVLDQSEAKIFAFQAVRVLEYPAVQQYVEWLADQRIKFGGGEVPPFQAAQELVRLARPE
jgi:hypothetical protein